MESRYALCTAQELRRRRSGSNPATHAKRARPPRNGGTKKVPGEGSGVKRARRRASIRASICHNIVLVIVAVGSNGESDGLGMGNHGGIGETAHTGLELVDSLYLHSLAHHFGPRAPPSFKLRQPTCRTAPTLPQ